MSVRFDDKYKWRILELFALPIITAALTGAVIWGATRERLDILVQANIPERLTRVETQFADIDKKLDRVLDKLDE